MNLGTLFLKKSHIESSALKINTIAFNLSLWLTSSAPGILGSLGCHRNNFFWIFLLTAAINFWIKITDSGRSHAHFAAFDVCICQNTQLGQNGYSFYIEFGQPWIVLTQVNECLMKSAITIGNKYWEWLHLDSIYSRTNGLDFLPLKL